MTSLNQAFAILSDYFYKTFMVVNHDKRSSMLFGVNDELQVDLVRNNIAIERKKNTGDHFW